MFGLSTSWNSHRHNNARSMVEEIKNLGINWIELNFTLSKDIVDDIAEIVESGLIQVSSLHNFCPVPDSIELDKASPDYYSLSSIDPAERAKAVSWTKHTIDTACRLKAKAVVIHAGRLNINDKTRALAKAIDAGIDAAPMIDAMRKERMKELKKGYLGYLIKSIDEITEHSKKCGIKIGLENRFYFRELPSIEEFEEIFERYDDSNIKYWHDTGHAQVFENLGLLRHKEYLEKFSSRLLGVHLHDVGGVINDHKAPLTGDFDFTILKPYLHKDVIRILEPHEPATAQEIKKALEYLKKLYGEK